MRDGTRWMHPGVPITPVLTVDRFGTLRSIRCVCGRHAHLDARRGSWRHSRTPWTGARKPKGGTA